MAKQKNFCERKLICLNDNFNFDNATKYLASCEFNNNICKNFNLNCYNELEYSSPSSSIAVAANCIGSANLQEMVTIIVYFTT